jgi:hypothetical protein
MVSLRLHATMTGPSVVTEKVIEEMLSGANSAYSSIDPAFDLAPPQGASVTHASGLGP